MDINDPKLWRSVAEKMRDTASKMNSSYYPVFIPLSGFADAIAAALEKPSPPTED